MTAVVRELRRRNDRLARTIPGRVVAELRQAVAGLRMARRPAWRVQPGEAGEFVARAR